MGSDGPPNAPYILIGEAPGADEAAFQLGQIPNGRPFVGPSGYMMKLRYLAPAGMVETAPNPKNPKWPIVKRLNAFIMNIVMCQPPKNDINSKEGKKAVACCHRSAIALLRERLAENPDAAVQAIGAVAANLIRGVAWKKSKGKASKKGIEKYRGRLIKFDAEALPVLTENEVLKKALHGIKPPEWWPPNEKVIRQILGWNRRSLKASLKPPKFPRGQALCKCGYIYLTDPGICTKCGAVYPVKEKKARVPRKKRTETAAGVGAVADREGDESDTL